jgi:hypothetical protein
MEYLNNGQCSDLKQQVMYNGSGIQMSWDLSTIQEDGRNGMLLP